MPRRESVVICSSSLVRRQGLLSVLIKGRYDGRLMRSFPLLLRFIRFHRMIVLCMRVRVRVRVRHVGYTRRHKTLMRERWTKKTNESTRAESRERAPERSATRAARSRAEFDWLTSTSEINGTR